MSDFKRFFFRGLAVLLPTVLTIWILIAAYQFVQQKIARPINDGVKQVVLLSTDYYSPTEDEVAQWLRDNNVTDWNDQKRAAARREVRRERLEADWGEHAFALDLIGLIAAVVLIYIVGALLSGLIGRRLYARGEKLLHKVPLFRQVYPFVKQVTDFLLGDAEEKLRFNKVVAVQYRTKGIWTVGLVTGDTMSVIEAAAGEPCMTVFIPSSPTPFTGYVITVPRRDTIDLPVTIEETLRFVVSGGVVMPPSQLIRRTGQEIEAENSAADSTVDVRRETSV